MRCFGCLLSCFRANSQSLVRGACQGHDCGFHLGSVVYQVGAFGGRDKQEPRPHHLKNRGKVKKSPTTTGRICRHWVSAEVLCFNKSYSNISILYVILTKPNSLFDVRLIENSPCCPIH